MNYDVHHIWEDQEDIRSLKSLILFGLRGMAAYAYHAYALDYVDRNVLDFFYEGLEAIASEKSSDELLALVLKRARSISAAWSFWIMQTPALMAIRYRQKFH